MEIIANAVQTVQANQNVLFTDTVVGCSNSLLHRTGSGLVTLEGNTTTQYGQEIINMTNSIFNRLKRNGELN